MEIPQRKSQISPPYVETYKRPVSTVRAEKHLAKAREYEYRTRMFQSFFKLGQQGLEVADKILEAKEATELMKAETTTAKMQQDFLLSLQDPDNPIPYGEWESRVLNMNAKIKEEVLSGMTVERSINVFLDRYERMSNDFYFDIVKAAQKQDVLQAVADFYESYNSILNNNSIADEKKKSKAYEYIAGAEAGYLIDPSEANRLKNETDSIIAYNKTYREMQGVLMEEGPDEARRYIYSVEGLRTDDLSELEKAIKEYESAVFDKELLRIAEAEADDTLSADLIFDSDLPVRGKYGKVWYLDRYNASAEKEMKSSKKKAEAAEYKNLMNDLIDEAESIDVTDTENLDSFIIKVDKAGLKGDDEDNVKRIAQTRRERFETEQEEAAESEEERKERALNSEWFSAYEGIRTGTITDGDQFRNAYEYPNLNTGDPEANKLLKNLDNELEKKQEKETPEVVRSDLEVLEWLNANYDNPDVDNKTFFKYVLDNKASLQGSKGRDYRNWMKDARERDVTNLDPARKDAVNIISETFKKLMKDVGIEEGAELRREKVLLINDYKVWLEQNHDVSYEEKIRKAEDMVSGFNSNRISKILEELTERREIRAGTMGMDKLLEITGYSITDIKTGKDREGYLTYKTPDGSVYRWNAKKDRLEVADIKKRKWKKAR